MLLLKRHPFLRHASFCWANHLTRGLSVQSQTRSSHQTPSNTILQETNAPRVSRRKRDLSVVEAHHDSQDDKFSMASRKKPRFSARDYDTQQNDSRYDDVEGSDLDADFPHQHLRAR